MFCEICDIHTNNTAEVGLFNIPFCEACLKSFMRHDDDLSPEVGDTVEFLASDEFGAICGQGTIMKIFKNKNAQIQKDGRPYRTHFYYVLARAA